MTKPPASWEIRKEALEVAKQLTLKTQEQHRVTRDPQKLWRVYNTTVTPWRYVDEEGNAVK